jgi:hypothetical protein
MGLFDRLLGKRPQDIVVLEPRKPEKPPARQTIIEAHDTAPLPPVLDESLPETLSLGWHYSETKQQLQMAKTKQQLQMAKIPLTDRAIHTYVIGASGSGKTVRGHVKPAREGQVKPGHLR